MIEKRALKQCFNQSVIYECERLEDAQAQIRKLTSLGIAIIDLNLAGKSGLDVVGLIRENSASATAPVLVISTSQLEDDIQRSYAAGASAYLFKSDNPEIFIRDIQSATRFFLRECL
jgi:DNA-binding NarL/FixJ family response regulator